MSKFPEVLYVVIDKTTGDTICDANPAALAMPDDSEHMARYVLRGTGEVVNETRYVENETRYTEK